MGMTRREFLTEVKNAVPLFFLGGVVSGFSYILNDVTREHFIEPKDIIEYTSWLKENSLESIPYEGYSVRTRGYPEYIGSNEGHCISWESFFSSFSNYRHMKLTTHKLHISPDKESPYILMGAIEYREVKIVKEGRVPLDHILNRDLETVIKPADIFTDINKEITVLGSLVNDKKYGYLFLVDKAEEFFECP